MKQLKAKLIEEFEYIEAESKCMQVFQEELQLLIQEKMAHLEELRQIQDDIRNVKISIILTDYDFYLII